MKSYEIRRYQPDTSLVIQVCTLLSDKAQHGDILSMTPVWAVEVPDRPSGLADLLAVLADAHVDVEYMYSLFTHKEGNAYMVMRISDEPRFLSTLGDRKIRIVGMEELGLK